MFSFVFNCTTILLPFLFPKSGVRLAPILAILLPSLLIQYRLYHLSLLHHLYCFSTVSTTRLYCTISTVSVPSLPPVSIAPSLLIQYRLYHLSLLHHLYCFSTVSTTCLYCTISTVSVPSLPPVSIAPSLLFQYRLYHLSLLHHLYCFSTVSTTCLYCTISTVSVPSLPPVSIAPSLLFQYRLYHLSLLHHLSFSTPVPIGEISLSNKTLPNHLHHEHVEVGDGTKKKFLTTLTQIVTRKRSLFQHSRFHIRRPETYAVNFHAHPGAL